MTGSSTTEPRDEDDELWLPDAAWVMARHAFAQVDPNDDALWRELTADFLEVLVDSEGWLDPSSVAALRVDLAAAEARGYQNAIDLLLAIPSHESHTCAQLLEARRDHRPGEPWALLECDETRGEARGRRQQIDRLRDHDAYVKWQTSGRVRGHWLTVEGRANAADFLEAQEGS